MPKVNRQAGIHLHTTLGVKKKASIKEPNPYQKEYYWILIARNGKTIARSSETYTRRYNAMNSIRVAANVFRFDFDGKYYENGEIKTMLV